MTLSVQSVQEAMKKITKHYHWNGPVGVSVTRAVTRVLGNQAAGKQLEAMMPDSKGKVATMIHTEAAAYAEMYFGPGRECEGVVLVVTVGTGMGTVTYNLGQKVRNSDLKHLTWTYERELAKMKEKWGWNGVRGPSFQRIATMMDATSSSRSSSLRRPSIPRMGQSA